MNDPMNGLGLGAADLAAGSRLLLGALRGFAGGWGLCPGHVATGARLLGGDAPRTFAMIERFVLAVAKHGRRRLRIAPPPCPALLPDEYLILGAWEAARSDDRDGLRARLHWVLGRADLTGIEGEARVLGRLLAAGAEADPGCFVLPLAPPGREASAGEQPRSDPRTRMLRAAVAAGRLNAGAAP